MNILHNAVKFSPDGGSISVLVRREGPDQVCMEVADSGPGIAPEHARKVFDRFYRVEESRSRESGGAGLGLAIAQWAVREHGGEIEVVPAPRTGCIFSDPSSGRVLVGPLPTDPSETETDEKAIIGSMRWRGARDTAGQAGDDSHR